MSVAPGKCGTSSASITACPAAECHCRVASQVSVAASRIQILTKSLRPLPDKWKGLADVEKRYRQRCAGGMIMCDCLFQLTQPTQQPGAGQAFCQGQGRVRRRTLLQTPAARS